METFFLKEDTKSINNTPIKSFNEILEECHNVNMMIIYNEIAWNNIIIKSINEDYKILLEDEQSSQNSTNIEGKGNTGARVQDSVKVIEVRRNMLEKIGDFFEKLIQSIINTISTVIDKLSNVSGMLKSYVAAHQKTILKGASLGVVKLEVNDWAGGLADANKLAAISISNPTPENISNIEEAFNNKIKSIINEESGKKEIKVTTSIASVSIKNVNICNKAIDNIKKMSYINQQQAKKGERLAKVDSTRIKDSNEFEKVKNEIEGQRNVCTICNKMNNKLSSILTKLLNDSHKINKACMKAANTKVKDFKGDPDKANKKDNDKSEENKNNEENKN